MAAPIPLRTLFFSWPGCPVLPGRALSRLGSAWLGLGWLDFPSRFHGVDAERGFLPEVKLMTLREMDPFVRFRIGGLVVSRSVKYLGEAQVLL